MADLIVIPVILLILYKLKYNKDGFNRDYLSVDTSTAIRGLMALDVVLFHYFDGLGGLTDKRYILHLFNGADAVKIFFFLSGFGLIYSYKKQGEHYLNDFFSRRFIKVLLPFVVAAIIYSVIFAYSNNFYGEAFTLRNIVSRFVFHGQPIVYNSWYVFELLAMYLLFYFSFKISKNDFDKGLRLAVISTMILMIGFYIAFEKTEWLDVYFFSTYSFAFGMVWAAKEEKIVAFIQKHFNTLVVTMLPAIIIFVIFIRVSTGIYDSDTRYIIKNLILGPFIVFGVIVGSMKFKLGGKVWHWLGTISYELYLIHGLAAFRYTSFMYIKNDLLFIVAALAGSVAAATVLHQIDNALLKGYFKLIDKNKQKAYIK